MSDVVALISTLSLLLECWYPGFRFPKPWPDQLAPTGGDLKLGPRDEMDALNTKPFTVITEDVFDKINQ